MQGDKNEARAILRFNYIVVEGNIGSGKTSLTHLLAKRYQSNIILEEFADNTFLPQFYKEPRRFAFPLELSFLAERYQQLQKSFGNKTGHLYGVVSDYLFDKSRLFAKINLPQKEYGLYRKFFNIMEVDIPKPELVIYLRRSPEDLFFNITKRGRDFEQAIDPKYLQKVSDSYERFFEKDKRYHKLIVEADGMDFVQNESDLTSIIDQIEGKMAPFQ